MARPLRDLERAVVRDVVLVLIADAVVGGSFGAITVSGGMPLWVPVLMSVVVFAGGSQFAATGVVLAGGGPVAAVIAGMVLNARLIPFGFVVRDLLGRRLVVRLIGTHLITDEAVAFAMAQRDPRARRQVYWLCGVGLFVVWNVAVVLGGLAGRGIGDVSVLGLDSAFPAVMLALVLPSLLPVGIVGRGAEGLGSKAGGSGGLGGGSAARGLRLTRAAAVVGCLLTLAGATVLPPGVPVLLALLALPLVRVPAVLRGTVAGQGDSEGKA